MIKKFLLIAIIFKLIFLAFTIYSLDMLVKIMIEHQGSKIINSQIKVGSASISLRTSTIEINKIKILNYDQFKNPYAAEIEKIILEINIRELFSKLVHVKKLIVEKPIITLEFTPQIDNLTFITKKAEQHARERSVGIKESHQEPFKVKIDQLVITSILVSTDIKNINKLSITIPDIKMSHLGGENGDYASKLIAQVLKVITKDVLKSDVKNFILHQIQQLLNRPEVDPIHKLFPGEVEKGAKKLLDNVFKSLK